MSKTCPNCHTMWDDDAKFCQNCGASLTDLPPAPPQPVALPEEPQKKPGMKWHKFLTYFALFMGALSNVLNALAAFTGSEYGEDLFYVQLVYPGIRILDFFYGAALLGFAVWAIVVRNQLSRFRKGAPQNLLRYYLAGGAASVLYICIAGAILGDAAMLSDAVGSVLGTLVVWLINKSYYKKREFLFVN